VIESYGKLASYEGARPFPSMRQYVVPLFTANGIAFAAIGVSYVLYSRLLTAQEFGIYSAALAIGTLATLILDGGVKVSIIKHTRDLRKEEESALLGWMLGLGVLLLLAVTAGRGLIVQHYPFTAHHTDFVAAFAAVYLVTYPWIGLPTAQLERRLAYSRLAWVESIGILLERGTPALFLYFTDAGLYSFVWSLALGRLFRVAVLARFHRVSLGVASRKPFREMLALMREGAWYQVGGSTALIRDNLHILIVGPAFGAAWIGYYAWGLQLCMIASQVFVQVSARISLPLTAQAVDFESRWRTVAGQVGVLMAVTAPILAAVLLVVPAADRQLLEAKWLPAEWLLPFLFARMLPGVACAPLGTLMLVERGSRAYAIALGVWTAIETVAAFIAIQVLGAAGLAVAYSVTAWVGMYVLIQGLRRDTLRLAASIPLIILKRPGVWLGGLIAALYMLDQAWNTEWLARASLAGVVCAAVAVVLVGCAVDSGLRRLIVRSEN
jgi:O-antigen/teichoic acid export membrane protein